MAMHVLDFEQPIIDLARRVRELRELTESDESLTAELERLQERASDLTREVFDTLSPLQRVQLSRHPNRPYALDYIHRLFTEFTELHGDRRFADDASIVGGLARFHGRPLVVVGQQKGRGTKDNVLRNFGMPNPEGYRKAIRLYELAERFSLPILTFVDTPGAYPGVGAEERGQSEAIAAALEVLARASTPVIATVIGEGGSGGALALSVANVILMLEHSYYSVISPEGCAAILWKSADQAGLAAEKLRITAPCVRDLGIADEVVPEPLGGAHRDVDTAAQLLGEVLWRHLNRWDDCDAETLRNQRYDKFRAMGAFELVG
jgi:acetyl-CoA carboxylase carboxyl transferase subunit alpha